MFIKYSDILLLNLNYITFIKKLDADEDPHSFWAIVFEYEDETSQPLPFDSEKERDEYFDKLQEKICVL